MGFMSDLDINFDIAIQNVKEISELADDPRNLPRIQKLAKSSHETLALVRAIELANYPEGSGE